MGHLGRLVKIMGEAAPVYEHVIDAEDRICALNEAWLAFARDNMAPHLTKDAVLGMPLWDFISDRTLRHLYNLIVQRVREDGHTRRFSYRCDSPATARKMLMEIVRLEKGRVAFRSRLRSSWRGEAGGGLLDVGLPRRQELLLMCSVCKMVNAPRESWVTLEEAIEEGALFETPSPPQVSHGLCPQCHAMLMDQLLARGENEPETL